MYPTGLEVGIGKSFWSSNPLLSFEENNHSHHTQYHETPNVEIAMIPMQFGHVLEVHSIHPHDEGQWNKDGSDNRQNAHHIICSDGDTTVI